MHPHYNIEGFRSIARIVRVLTHVVKNDPTPLLV